MHGVIVSFSAKPGSRDALVSILTESSAAMPGCLSYIIATDPHDPERIWITEVWVDAAHHKASLALPQVRAAIEQAMPLIGEFGSQTLTTPVAGIGAA